METHSSVPAWRIPGMGEPGGLPSMGLCRVRHNWRNLAEALEGKPAGAHNKESTCRCRTHKRLRFKPWVGIPWRRAWQPTPVFLPGESNGQRSLVDYSPQGRKESNTTETTYHACMQKGKIVKTYFILHKKINYRWVLNSKHGKTKLQI